MAHCNTVLSQLLKLVDRYEFDSVASVHQKKGHPLARLCQSGK